MPHGSDLEESDNVPRRAISKGQAVVPYPRRDTQGGVSALDGLHPAEKYERQWLTLKTLETIKYAVRKEESLFYPARRSEMHSIEVDFEVWKELTMRRSTESTTYNDVVRELLDLDPIDEDDDGYLEDGADDGLVMDGVVFPEGTEFRAILKGREYRGVVEGGALVYNGVSYCSPSPAGVAITGYPVNGWRFWEARFPTSSEWKLLDTYRRNS
jgi:hypothetical protein